MSVIRRWLLALNTFRIVAKNSDENGMKQIIYHDAALKALVDAYGADTDYPVWYNRFHPLKEDANTKYNAYYTIQGAQEGKTVNVNAHIKGIQGELGLAHDWFNRTAVVYKISNPPRFKSIFPDGLKPFKGKKDKIIGALSTLSANIGADADPLMEAIKAEVDAEYAIINPARSGQKTAIKATGISSTTLNTAINTALNMEFRNYGLAVNKYAGDVNMEAELKFPFDLDAIQNGAQKIFTLTLNNPETKDVVVRTMVFNSRLRAKATGGSVKIYLATTLGGTNSTAVAITDGEPLDFIAADFGITDYGIHRFVTVVTASGTVISFMLQLY